MKQPALPDFKRLEQQIDLLNNKIDRLLAAQGIVFVPSEAAIQKELNKKHKNREQMQRQLQDNEAFQQQVLQGMQDQALRLGYGKMLQQQFDLLQSPSADRIREYQQTNDPKAFNGLRRVGQEKKK